MRMAGVDRVAPDFEHDVQIASAAGVANSRREFRLGKPVGQINQDRARLAHRGVTVNERRHLHHWIDRAIVGALLVPGHQIELDAFIGNACLFEHPKRPQRPRARSPIKLDHRCLLLASHMLHRDNAGNGFERARDLR